MRVSWYFRGGGLDPIATYLALELSRSFLAANDPPTAPPTVAAMTRAQITPRMIQNLEALMSPSRRRDPMPTSMIFGFTASRGFSFGGYGPTYGTVSGALWPLSCRILSGAS